MAIVNRKNTDSIVKLFKYLNHVVTIALFPLPIACKWNTNKGSIFTINKNDGNIIFSSKADDLKLLV